MNEFCLANIGPRQRRLRLGLGLASLTAALAVVASPYVLGLSPALRWLSLPFVYGALLGILQHREKT
jgi:hypothetical protein